MLTVIGLGSEVEQVYEVLLNARPAAATELIGVTGLTQPRVQAALRSLEELGLVTGVPGTPHSYVAIDPGLTLDALLLNREEQLRRARARADEISERFRRAVTERDPAEPVEVVTGIEAILDRMDQMQRSARVELRFLDRPPYISGTEASDIEAEFLRDGGVVRAIYEAAAIDVPNRLDCLEGHFASGEQSRVLPVLPTKFILIDDRMGSLPLRVVDDRPGASYLVVHRSALLEALSGLFEALWPLALPLGDLYTAPGGDPKSGSDDGPDTTEWRILALMNAGLPDEAIARHLGLSHRTLQRRISGLMGRLDAHTRYQLGARAAARGWAVPRTDNGGEAIGHRSRSSPSGG